MGEGTNCRWSCGRTHIFLSSSFSHSFWQHIYIRGSPACTSPPAVWVCGWQWTTCAKQQLRSKVQTVRVVEAGTRTPHIATGRFGHCYALGAAADGSTGWGQRDTCQRAKVSHHLPAPVVHQFDGYKIFFFARRSLGEHCSSPVRTVFTGYQLPGKVLWCVDLAHDAPISQYRY